MKRRGGHAYIYQVTTFSSCATRTHLAGEMESSVGTTKSETRQGAGKQMKLHIYLTCNYMSALEI